MDNVLYRTLDQRTADATAARIAAIRAVEADLLAYAQQEGGRFILYGTAANGGIRQDSDIDLLIDFPPDKVQDAWGAAEDACGKRGVPLDALPLAWAKVEFLKKIEGRLRTLE